MTVLLRSRFREKRLKYIRMIRVHAEVGRSSRSAVERGDFMKTLQEALKIGESIDTEFKSWIKVSNMRERISLAVDELIAFVN